MQCLGRVRPFLQCIYHHQQVAHYNDPYVKFVPRWKDRMNRKRKTVRLKKMLSEYEPTVHDKVFSEAVRYSEAEFRVQMLDLRRKWAKVYEPTTCLSAEEVEYNSEYEREEEKREAFIAELEKRQAEKKGNFPDTPTESDNVEEVSLEQEYRVTLSTDPLQEIEHFLALQKSNQLFTPANLNEKLDQLLSVNKPSYIDFITTEDNVVAFAKHNIEFLIE